MLLPFGTILFLPLFVKLLRSGFWLVGEVKYRGRKKKQKARASRGLEVHLYE
jgi:hypothetical protein